jgi:hypothetical protein
MARLGVTGHQHLPPRTVELVEAALRELLEPYDAGDLIGVTCLADGADQLFARAVLARGGVLEVVIPAVRYRDGLRPEAWPSYDELLDRAQQVEHLAFEASTEEAHLAAGQAVVDRSDLVVAVWDGAPARGLGGTADVVTYARKHGVPVTIIWPEGASRD